LTTSGGIVEVVLAWEGLACFSSPASAGFLETAAVFSDGVLLIDDFFWGEAHLKLKKIIMADSKKIKNK